MLSDTIQSLYRVVKHFELFGINGYKLWKHKQIKNRKLVSYNLKGFLHPIYLRTASSDYQTFEQIFLRKEYQFAVSFTPKVIIDCGANIGFASVYYAMLYPNATIIAIEPELSNFELLKKNTAHFSNIHCINAGIWNKKTHLQIVDAEIGEWGFTVVETDQASENSIPATSIPELIQLYHLNTIDILKIDIEGSEIELFSKPPIDWIDKVNLLIIELHDRMRNDTAKTFFNAVNQKEYSIEMKGENIFMQFNDAKNSP